jgi:hypothetical protein
MAGLARGADGADRCFRPGHAGAGGAAHARNPGAAQSARTAARHAAAHLGAWCCATPRSGLLAADDSRLRRAVHLSGGIVVCASSRCWACRARSTAGCWSTALAYITAPSSAALCWHATACAAPWRWPGHSASGRHADGAAGLAGWHQPWALLAAAICSCSATAFTSPAGRRAPWRPFPQAAGAASALNGFMMMLAAFAIGGWVGTHLDGTVWPLVHGVWFWSVALP